MRRFIALLAIVLIGAASARAVDYSVTSSSVIPSSDATISRGTAGAAITAGQAVCKDTDGTIKLCDSNASGNLHIFAGIAVNSASVGQPVLYCNADPTGFTPGFTVAAGAVVIVSAVAGNLCPVADLTTGDYLVVVGVGIGSNKIILQPLSTGVATP